MTTTIMVVYAIVALIVGAGFAADTGTNIVYNLPGILLVMLFWPAMVAALLIWWVEDLVI